MTPSHEKITFLEDYFNSKCNADAFTNAFEYMNCIKLKEADEDHKYRHGDFTYKVAASDNDGFKVSDIVMWSDISDYIDDIVNNGVQDDIDVLYCFLTDKN